MQTAGSPLEFTVWLQRCMEHKRVRTDSHSKIQILADQSLGMCISALWRLLRQQGTEIIWYNAARTPLRDVARQLEMASVTTSCETTVWLFAEVDGVVQALDKKVLNYCAAYQGPHTLVLVTPSSQRIKDADLSVVVVPAQLSESLLSVLYQLVNGVQAAPVQGVPVQVVPVQAVPAQVVPVVRSVYKILEANHRSLGIAHACAIVPHLRFAGRSLEALCTRWLHRMLPSDISLFTLRTHLLARDMKSFYRAWNAVSGLYPDDFWLVFWMDFFWQAYKFSTIAHQRGVDAAGAYVKGLPFAFVRSGWRGADQGRLVRSIEQLYAFDRQRKAGGMSIPFDLIFQNFA